MKYNDIAVNLKGIDSARHKINKSMNEIETFANQLKLNLKAVSKDFNSQNFIQAEEVVNRVIKQLYLAQEKLQKGRVFLNNIEEKTELYMKCKYIR